MTSIVNLLLKAKRNQIAMMADRNYSISSKNDEKRLEDEGDYNNLLIDEFIDRHDENDKRYMSFLNVYYEKPDGGLVYVLFFQTPNDRKMNADVISKVYPELAQLEVDHVIFISEIPPNKRALESVAQIDTINWEFFTYEELVKNPTRCVYNSEHRILNQEEKDVFIAQISKSGGSIRDIPVMTKNDMTGRWYGVKPGDVVEIIQASPADIAIERNLFYRIVR